jgi:hypothetical protein
MARTDGKKQEETVRIRLSVELLGRCRAMQGPSGWGSEAESSFLRHLIEMGVRQKEFEDKKRQLLEETQINKRGKMYQDDISEEEANDDFLDLLEKVKPMNPDITDWSKYTSTKDTSGMVEVLYRLINDIKRGIINGPKGDIPVSLKDVEDLVETKIRDIVREELEDYKDDTEQKSRKKKAR